MRCVAWVGSLAIGVTISSLAMISNGPARAASLSFSGSFTADDDVALFSFDVDDPSRVTIRTFSYGGGTLDDGTTVDPGGFDPILTLFDNDGSFINDNDDMFGRRDPDTDSAYDSGLRPILDPGTYTVAVTQYDNFFNDITGNLLDGFQRDGQPNFTNDDSDFDGCTAGQFCDVNGDSRTNDWVAQVRVPEPSSAVASGLLLGGIVAGRRRRKRL